MSKTKLCAPTIEFLPKSLVRIVSSDNFNTVAMTGGHTRKGAYHMTTIQFLHPDSGELVTALWRTEWLEACDEMCKKAEDLLCAINRLNQDNSESSRSSPEWPDCANKELLPPDCHTSSESPSSSRLTPIADPSCENTTLTSQDMTTLELSVANQETLTSLLVDSHAEGLAQLEQERDSLTRTLTSGLKCFGLSMKPAQLLWSLKMWAVLLIEGFERALEDSEWSDISGTIRKSYQQRKLERPTEENGCSLLPTPMAHSRAKNTYRSPGGDKLEQKLRLLPTPRGRDGTGGVTKPVVEGGNLEAALQPLIPKGHVSHPAVREYMMGFPTGWTDTTELDGGPTTTPQQTYTPLPEALPIDPAELPPSEIAVLPSNPQLSGEELQSLPELELTLDEERDRLHLERKVEKAFYEAGKALRELRDRRLYRSTHPDNFVGYCRDRFGKSKQAVNYLIAATGVYENLTTTNGCRDDNQETTTNGCRDDNQETTTIGGQILPTNERQVRDLVPLEPNEQRQVWQEAVESTCGKVPSGKVVKGIVERLYEKTATPPPPEYSEGDVVEIHALSNSTIRKHNGCWGIVTHVGTWSYTVHISVRGADLQCKGSEMERVDEENIQQILEVSDRVGALARCNLDPAAWSILETLNRQTCFTDVQMDLLNWLEVRYGIKQHDN